MFELCEPQLALSQKKYKRATRLIDDHIGGFPFRIRRMNLTGCERCARLLVARAQVDDRVFDAPVLRIHENRFVEQWTLTQTVLTILLHEENRGNRELLVGWEHDLSFDRDPGGLLVRTRGD